jgi:hypothetical protein
MSARVRAIGASKLWLWPTTSCTPAERAASTIARHSPRLSAIGFSTSTCLPRLAARQACAAWNACGVAMYTTSTAGSAQSSSTLP